MRKDEECFGGPVLIGTDQPKIYQPIMGAYRIHSPKLNVLPNPVVTGLNPRVACIVRACVD